MLDKRQKIIGEDATLFQHIWETGKGFYITVSILGALVLWGLYAYITQYRNGLTVTGLSRQIFWGVYITNFVFFIGISHAGTFISAVLRVLKAEWRRPISRLSELTTVFILMFGVGSVLIDLGRPDRMLYAIRYANFTSPLLWDVCSITMYLTVSSISLYLALIPDIAMLRDLGGKKEWFYRILSLGWRGTEDQHYRLDKAIGFVSVLVIPVMITVHTVVSFVFAMTIQPLWHSAIFGPYFVVGAIFSGVASVIVVMALLRRAYHLESYIKPIHFNNIGIFLMAMTNLAYILERLVKNNKPRSTPVAVITHGTTSRQRCVIGTLQDILSRVESEKLQPPVVVVVGEVVRLREYLRWFDK
jgi:Ni/Fe-hydrogenase subunit HybB-like protein